MENQSLKLGDITIIIKPEDKSYFFSGYNIIWNMCIIKKQNQHPKIINTAGAVSALAEPNSSLWVILRLNFIPLIFNRGTKRKIDDFVEVYIGIDLNDKQTFILNQGEQNPNAINTHHVLGSYIGNQNDN